MNETPQMQADRALAEDRAARAAMRDGHDVETAARAALAAIHREARERAAPYVDALARLEAARPPLPVLIVTRGDGVPLPDQPAAVAAFVRQATGDALGDRFGQPPYSRADRVRNALLAAFVDESATTRARLRKLLAAASDATLEAAARYLKHG